MGQLRPGDTVRFVPVREADAASLRDRRATPALARTGGDGDDGILARRDGGPDAPAVVYRRDGDDNVIVEYGDPVLDLGLRMRVHALQEALAAQGLAGVIDLTPGIRSLQIHTDAARLPARSLLPLLQQVEDTLPPAHELRVPSRTVRLPLSWDDPATRLAIERYMHGVRSDAPWTPWNIEFIRRINGLATPEDVREIVFAARYLVLGLGDVYLGAPVATPVDPRHRLVTTKYNPARTWTAENSVGIGGAYLCIYGMEGPGGYQFVGRTTQVWNRFRRAGLFAEQPWALRFFDRIEWYPVSAEELLDLRAETEAGRGHVDVADGWFDYGSYTRFLAANAASIARSALGSRRHSPPRRGAGVPAASSTGPSASRRRRRPGRGGAGAGRGDRGDRAVHRERLAGRRPARHAGSQGRQARVAGGDEDGDDHRRAPRRDRGGGLHRRRDPGRGGPGAAGAGPATGPPGQPAARRAAPSDERVSPDERRRTGHGRVRLHRRGRPPRGLDHAPPGGRGPGRSRRDRRRGRRRRATAAGRPGGRRQGQHRRGRAAHHGGRALVRVPARAGRHLRRPAARRPGRWCSARPTSTSSRPASSAPAARTARSATRGIRRGSPAAPVPGRRSRWRSAWSISPSERTRRAPVGCPPR